VHGYNKQYEYLGCRKPWKKSPPQKICICAREANISCVVRARAAALCALLCHLGRRSGVQYKVRVICLYSVELTVIVDRYGAKLAFEEDFADGNDPELLSTDDFEMVLVYAEGDV
jgi:hypothetical protein